MSDQLLTLLAGLALGIAIGGSAIAWIKSRPVTTKAEAMRLLAKEFALVANLPGANEAHALAEAQAQDEALASAALAKAMQKAAGAAPTV